jgi:hypothetical protein
MATSDTTKIVMTKYFMVPKLKKPRTHDWISIQSGLPGLLYGLKDLVEFLQQTQFLIARYGKIHFY